MLFLKYDNQFIYFFPQMSTLAFLKHFEEDVLVFADCKNTVKNVLAIFCLCIVVSVFLYLSSL